MVPVEEDGEKQASCESAAATRLSSKRRPAESDRSLAIRRRSSPEKDIDLDVHDLV